MQKQYPFYVKSTIILFGLVLFVYVIFNLREILVPLAFALLIAILLNPLVNWFQKKKINRIVAISLALLIGFLFIVGIGYFLSVQIAGFTDQFPIMKQKFLSLMQQLQQMLDQRFNIDVAKQNKVIEDAQAGIKPLLGSTAGTVMSTLAAVVLLPVYSFLFLFYKNLLLNFIFEVFAEDYFKQVGAVLNETRGAIQNYMFGLLAEALVVAILNSLALLILGVKYWILLGVLGAILNILPYIGGIVSTALPVIIATIYKDGFHTQLLIIGAYLLIQFIDNHFLVPYIVSSKVKINALVSIVVVLLGNAAWGVPGMFLSIPFAGILKIVFDRIDDMKPWGRLLGDEIPSLPKQWPRLRRRKPAIKVAKETT